MLPQHIELLQTYHTA